MMQVQFENQEFELVKEIILDHSINYIYDEINFHVLIDAEKEFFELLLDYVTDLLITKGISNGEVNAFGYSIEGLIDKLSSIIYE